MFRPAITDYIDTLDNPDGVFRTLGEIRAERDVYGAVRLRAGNSAAIFTYMSGRIRRFLKCYIRPNPHLRAIYDYVEKHRPPLLPEVRLLRDEMFVHTLGGEAGWVDVVEGKWTQGETLAAAVARAVAGRNGERLAGLADSFDALWSRLSREEWAHGDLKPDNIIVKPDGEAILVDCDAMWIPSLAGQRAAELGTPPYRDPRRTAADFDKTIDDHSARLVSTALHALARHPDNWNRYTTFEEFLSFAGNFPGTS